jgi:arsenate reductase (glutaredoxin)
MTTPTTVYHYPACSTCRRALKWLDANGIAHERVHIVEQPPSVDQLERAVALGLPLRSLFNTSGQSYRDGNLKERLPTMSQGEALQALARDGKLIKRPLVLSAQRALAGFDEESWTRSLR